MEWRLEDLVIVVNGLVQVAWPTLEMVGEAERSVDRRIPWRDVQRSVWLVGAERCGWSKPANMGHRLELM